MSILKKNFETKALHIIIESMKSASGACTHRNILISILQVCLYFYFAFLLKRLMVRIFLPHFLTPQKVALKIIYSDFRLVEILCEKYR